MNNFNNQNNTNEEMSKKDLLRKWLEQLQQESWQLELLISGFALFGIYSSKNWIDDIILTMETDGYGPFSAASGLVFLLLRGGWLIFFINLLVHVILRGLWIGAIGLRYVSEEIEYDKLDYNQQFSNYLKKKVGDYDDYIERLEKVCSVLFAYTFLLFLLLVSLLMFFAVYGMITLLVVKFRADNAGLSNLFGLVTFAYLILGFFVFIDFISLGGLKKVQEPLFSKIYMKVYQFYSIITLSFLYRPLLYNFIDDRYTKRLFWLSIPYIFIVLFHSVLFNNEPYPYWNERQAVKTGHYLDRLSYDDERQKWYDENNMRKELNKKEIPNLVLSQFMVDKPYLEIFLKMKGNDQFLLERIDSLVPYRKPGFRFSFFSGTTVDDPERESIIDARKSATKPFREQKSDLRRLDRKDKSVSYATQMDSLQDIINSINEDYEQKLEKHSTDKMDGVINSILDHHRLKIDGEPINDNLECYQYLHPNFNEHGLLCIYPLDSISMGKHLLELERDLYDYSDEEVVERYYKLPFYKVN